MKMFPKFIKSNYSWMKKCHLSKHAFMKILNKIENWDQGNIKKANK
jgi:hypothetical protein